MQLQSGVWDLQCVYDMHALSGCATVPVCASLYLEAPQDSEMLLGTGLHKQER